MELRCDHKLFGIVDDHTLEVKCGSQLCGARPGVVVFHRFDLRDASWTTQTYQDPKFIQEREMNGPSN